MSFPQLRSIKSTTQGEEAGDYRSSKSPMNSADAEPTPLPRSSQVTSSPDKMTSFKGKSEMGSESELPSDQSVSSEDVDMWNSCLVASQNEIGVQLQREITALKNSIVNLEQERNELMNLVARECAASSVNFFSVCSLIQLFVLFLEYLLEASNGLL